MSAIATKTDAAAIEREVRALLDALDRMHGRTHVSYNVSVAYQRLRLRFPVQHDPSDKTTEPPSP